MAALAANKVRKQQHTDLRKRRNVAVAAGVKIFAGAIVALDALGNAVIAPAGQTLKFLGIALNYVDNSAEIVVTPTEVLTVEIGQIEIIPVSTVPTNVDIGKPVYYLDDGTVTLTAPAELLTKVGILHMPYPIGTNNAYIDTSKSTT